MPKCWVFTGSLCTNDDESVCELQRTALSARNIAASIRKGHKVTSFWSERGPGVSAAYAHAHAARSLLVGHPS